MAKDFRAYFVADGIKRWSEKPDDTVKKAEQRRKGVLAKIDQFLKAAQGEDKEPRGMVSTKNDLAKVQLKSGFKVVKIDGQDELFVQAGEVVPFFQALRGEVEKGALDDAIKSAHGEGDATAKKPRKQMDEATKAERNRKRAATIAAKKAAEGANA